MEQLSSEEVRETHNVYPARDAERSQHAFDTERIEAAGKTEAPIGVFDSGVGGLTVLSALRQELPHENYVYFGDTAHCPYGMRSDAEIIELSRRGCQFLIEQGAKLIVLAVGCPELVTLVEHGELDGPVAEEVVRVALEPILKEDIDVIVLGCTHFPALRSVIERITNKRVRVIDSGA